MEWMNEWEEAKLTWGKDGHMGGEGYDELRFGRRHNML